MRIAQGLVLVLVLLASGMVMSKQDADPEDAPPASLEVEPMPDELEALFPAEADEVEPMEWLRSEGFDTVICPFRNRIDYDRGDIECGLIQVPENREVPGSRTIELHFVRIRARGEDHEGNPVEIRDDPVLYLTGGPGVTVEGYVRRLKDHRLMASRDLYILEQRGIGHSGDFCPFFFDRNRADHVRSSFAAQQRSLFDMAMACADGARAAGVDLTGYHTFENARDIRALRLALGYETWNVWGISYGSVLGQAYMKVDPDGLRAAVLDAIVPLDLHDLMRIPHWHTQNLDRLFAACAEQPRCARAFDGLEPRYRSAIASMTERPIALTVPASEIHPTGEAYFFQDLIAGLPFSLLYEESTHAALPAILDGLSRAVEQRDERFFRALALAQEQGGDNGGFGISMGMSMAVRCLDGYIDRWSDASPDDFRDYPVLARAFGDLGAIREAPRRCREAGMAPRDPANFELVQTDLPIIVANGAWDPITPVPLAEYIMPGFEQGRLVVFPHAGHGPTRSVECAGDFLNAFFDDPLAELDMSCVEEGGEEARFFAPYFRTSTVQRAIIMKAEHEERLKRHGIWAGASLGLTLIGLVGLLLGWFSRRLNGFRVQTAGGARLVVFMATAAAAAWLGGLGAAAYATAEVTEAMLLFGMVPWAMWYSWLGPLSALLGIFGLIQTWRHKHRLRLASALGLTLVSASVISLSIAGLVWDLWPL